MHSCNQKNTMMGGSSSAIVVAAVMLLLASSSSTSCAFAFTATSVVTHRNTMSSTVMFAMNKKNKFNKQKDLAAKMAEAKRQRELAEGGDVASATSEDASSKDATNLSSSGQLLSDKEIKLRNDRQRFADMLENSMSSANSDLGDGYYLTVEQENENANAVYRGITRLYEGDPAPTSPFVDLLNIETGEPIGQGGMKRLVPWEGSRSASSSDYLIVVTDPRPKSVELRTAMKRLAGGLSNDMLAKCVVINTDTPAENRRFVKKNFAEDSGADKMTVLTDEKMDFMREYTALGEKVRSSSFACKILISSFFTRHSKFFCLSFNYPLNSAEVFHYNVHLEGRKV